MKLQTILPTALFALFGTAAFAQTASYSFQVDRSFNAKGANFPAGSYTIRRVEHAANQFIIAHPNGKNAYFVSMPVTEQIKREGAPILRLLCSGDNCQIQSFSDPSSGLRFMPWKSPKPAADTVEVAVKMSSTSTKPAE